MSSSVSMRKMPRSRPLSHDRKFPHLYTVNVCAVKRLMVPRANVIEAPVFFEVVTTSTVPVNAVVKVTVTVAEHVNAPAFIVQEEEPCWTHGSVAKPQPAVLLLFVATHSR